MTEIQDDSTYPDLLWAINGTRELKLSSDTSKQDLEILSIIDKKITTLKRAGCEGIQDKFKKFDQPNAITYLAELVVAEFFLKRGHKVILLGSNVFPGASPDFLVKTGDGKFFIEITYMSSSDPGEVLVDDLREITREFPYIVNFSFEPDVSIPHNERNQREHQLKKLEESAIQFASDLRKIQPENFPYSGKTDTFSYEIVGVSKSGIGYPGVLTSSFSLSHDFSDAYLALRLLRKGVKRRTFPSASQEIPYVIAFVCNEMGINSYDASSLLYGSTIGYSFLSNPRLPEEHRKRMEQRRWEEILLRVSSQGWYAEVLKAREKGWERLLSSKYLLPHENCYIEEPGIFLTEDIMRQVSGVLFFRCNGSCNIFPNPFSKDEMEFSPFWENL